MEAFRPTCWGVERLQEKEYIEYPRAVCRELGWWTLKPHIQINDIRSREHFLEGRAICAKSLSPCFVCWSPVPSSEKDKAFVM